MIKTITKLSEELDLSRRQTERIIESGVIPRSNEGWTENDVRRFKKFYSLKKAELISIIFQNEKINKQKRLEIKKLRSLKEDTTIVSIKKLQLT